MQPLYTYRLVIAGIVAAAGLAVSASVFAAVAPDTARLVARGWAPWMALANAGTPQQTLALIRRSLHVDRTVFNALQLSDELDDISAAVLDSLNDFDLNQLYQRLPEAHDGWHSLAVTGAMAGGHYAVERIPVAGLDAPLTSLGAMQGVLSLYPLPDPRGTRYNALMRFQANVGPTDWASVLEALHLALLNISQPSTIAPPPAARAAIRAMNAGLTPSEQRLLAQIRTAFPASLDWYAGFGTISDVIAENDSSARATYFKLVYQLRREPLRAQYPGVASYLEDLGDLLTAKVAVEGDHGLWLTATLDTASLRTSIDFWLADGELVPTRGGRPMLAQVEAGFPERSRWRSVLSLQLRAFGVKLDIADLTTRWRYDRVPAGAHIVGLTSTVPEVAVDGRLLGILPVGWVEGLSPVSIKGTVDDFMQVLVDSNKGDGARLIAHYDDSGKRGSTLMLAADWDGLNNFFVRLGVGMVSDHVIPDAEQADGIRRILTDALIMFGRDLDRWARILARR